MARQHKEQIMGDWENLREGIDRKELAVEEELGIRADLIRIKANFCDVEHIHHGFEWVYIIEGGFSDDRGQHKAGEFIINSTEGIHQVKTGDEGCLLLIVWTGKVSKV
jgi:anti-sigma factor ChrR (cupin superfamily)